MGAHLFGTPPRLTKDSPREDISILGCGSSGSGMETAGSSENSGWMRIDWAFCVGLA